MEESERFLGILTMRAYEYKTEISKVHREVYCTACVSIPHVSCLPYPILASLCSDDKGQVQGGARESGPWIVWPITRHYFESSIGQGLSV
jgi:hypothetical protein